MARRPKNVTPQLQFMVVCQRIEVDEDGGISFRNIFDSVTPSQFPVQMKFAVSTQFRGGTGEHKYWVVIKHPSGREVATQENSFWLASTALAHRNDSRVTMGLGPDDVGRFEITGMLDGRPVATVPITVTPPPAKVVGPGETTIDAD